MRTLLSVVLVLGLVGFVQAEDKAEDTPAAAKARKLLKQKLSVDYKNTRLEDVKNELMEEVKGLKIMLDAKGGVSRNRTVTFKGKEVTIEEVLEGVCKNLGGLGYIVVSKKGNAYDGTIVIRVGEERGYEKEKK
jgi:hypothetical protein